VVLADDGGVRPDAASRALQAVAAQDVEPAARIFVAGELTTNYTVMANATGWQMLPSAWGPRYPVPARLMEELAAAGAPFAYVGAADDVLAPGALRKAGRFLANHPDFGACACWTGSAEDACAAFRSDALHLLAPAMYPERWFFRIEALQAVGGLFVNGSHLPDLLRDAVLRLVTGGWRVGCIGEALIVPGHRESAPLLAPFAFNERRDSVRAVALAHVSRVATDPLALGETLTGWAD
jgi:hypothetical protein